MENFKRTKKKISLWVGVGLLVLAGFVLKYLLGEVKYLKQAYEMKKIENQFSIENR